MSKRWRVRKLNAAKRERSNEVIDQFYDNVVAALEKAKTAVEQSALATTPVEESKTASA